jgi:hypothetical protein
MSSAMAKATNDLRCFMVFASLFWNCERCLREDCPESRRHDSEQIDD